MDKIKTAVKEPSTWAALAAILSPLLAIFHVDAQTGAAVISITGALGVILRERGGAK